MPDISNLISIPVFVGLMVFAVLAAFIASAPTAWVDLVERFIKKRQAARKP